MIKKKNYCRFIFLMVMFIPFLTEAQPREKQSINSGWQFVLNDKAKLNSKLFRVKPY